MERFETFTLLVSKLSRSIRKIKSEEMAEFGLKGPHVSCLYYLSQCGGLTASELCERCEEDKAAVSRSLDYLEKNGYVERIPDPEDSRGVKVRLTEKGRALKPAFDAISKGLQAIITDRLSEEEALKLEQLLAACVEKHADGKC